MKIAFYAPMKTPNHPVPSGDRLMGRLLMDAMQRSGHDVELACELRAWVGDGNRERQVRLRKAGSWVADRLISRYRQLPPDIWFTYHLYYKAVDWIGPTVAKALNIPYVAAEVSISDKRANGPWSMSHQAVLDAIHQCRLIVSLNPVDEIALGEKDLPNTTMMSLRPFVEVQDYPVGNSSRSTLAYRYGLDETLPWLICAAMMRPGNKTESYIELGDALKRLNSPYHMLVAGDGKTRPQVEEALGDLPVTFLGRISQAELNDLYGVSEVFVWPGVDEAWGMVYLEAQAAGLPVVASRHGGVPNVIDDGVSGLIVDAHDMSAFADAIELLLRDEPKRKNMGRAAHGFVEAHCEVNKASMKLDAALRQVAS